MTREQADKYVDDIQMIAQGISNLIQHVEEDESLAGMSITEIIFAIQETGALEEVAHEFMEIVEKSQARLGEIAQYSILLNAKPEMN